MAMRAEEGFREERQFMKEQTTQWDEWKKVFTGTDKKVWIVTAAVLLVLLAAGGFFLHGFGTRQQGQDELCPYQWEQKSSGELVVTVDASAVKDADFNIVTPEDAEIKTECEIRQSGSKIRCTFRGTEMGVTQVILQGQRTEPVPETVCQIRLVLSVQEDLSVEVVEAEETEAVTFQKVDAENAFPCYYIPYTEESSTALEIQVQQTEDDNWMFLTEGDVMTVSVMRYQGTCYMGILARESMNGAITEEAGGTETMEASAAGEVSEAKVMIYNTVEDVQYTFVFSVMSDNTLVVKSAAAGGCEITEEGNSIPTLEVPDFDSND